ncbi:MAG: hypothetical protein IPK68_22400 [Bdellovibrionales bacterium]|nr:hypothetical protein [Bdellovibrionales bacterium]
MFFALLFGSCARIAEAEEFDCADLPLAPVIERTVSLTPTEDFPLRDSLPRTEIPTLIGGPAAALTDPVRCLTPR